MIALKITGLVVTHPPPCQLPEIIFACWHRRPFAGTTLTQTAVSHGNVGFDAAEALRGTLNAGEACQTILRNSEGKQDSVSQSCQCSFRNYTL